MVNNEYSRIGYYRCGCAFDMICKNREKANVKQLLQ